MMQKDLDTRSHIIFFTKEEIDNGYTYCNDMVHSIQNRFPDHTFIGLPDTIAIKELGAEAVQEMIKELQDFLENISKEEDSNE